MTRLLYSGALLVVLSATAATAQNASNSTLSNNPHRNLTPAQQQMVSNSLSSTPSQSAPSGAQPQVGDKVPESMSAQSMPHNVVDQVPEAKELLVVKLPDSILIIDPDTRLISQIVMDPTTTGSAAGNKDR